MHGPRRARLRHPGPVRRRAPARHRRTDRLHDRPAATASSSSASPTARRPTPGPATSTLDGAGQLVTQQRRPGADQAVPPITFAAEHADVRRSTTRGNLTAVVPTGRVRVAQLGIATVRRTRTGLTLNGQNLYLAVGRLGRRRRGSPRPAPPARSSRGLPGDGQRQGRRRDGQHDHHAARLRGRSRRSCRPPTRCSAPPTGCAADGGHRRHLGHHVVLGRRPLPAGVQAPTTRPSSARCTTRASSSRPSSCARSCRAG